ncbi:MAG TPA: hypothetical protein VMT15_12325 [Bryobacteraceae bacterium]|nr:hypothetical protein [Bryobacteraceae bacterium]
MKPENAGSGKPGSSQRKTMSRGRVPVRIPQIPMEWMDPMSWRLPSGKALAEFALQAGFLAPLMMGAPRLKKRKITPPAVPPAEFEKGVKGAPELPGTFRARRF